MCERACGADGCRLPAFAGQLPHSITALAVQKDLTFAAVRTDILVCQRVHWCAARLACVARLRSAISHRLPQAGPAQQRERLRGSGAAACCTAHPHAWPCTVYARRASAGHQRRARGAAVSGRCAATEPASCSSWCSASGC